MATTKIHLNDANDGITADVEIGSKNKVTLENSETHRKVPLTPGTPAFEQVMALAQRALNGDDSRGSIDDALQVINKQGVFYNLNAANRQGRGQLAGDLSNLKGLVR